MKLAVDLSPPLEIREGSHAMRAIVRAAHDAGRAWRALAFGAPSDVAARAWVRKVAPDVGPITLGKLTYSFRSGARAYVRAAEKARHREATARARESRKVNA